jgi:hypothetical protein
MRGSTTAVLVLGVCVGIVSLSFSQVGGRPTQPPDPTAQSPATAAPSSPATSQSPDPKQPRGPSPTTATAQKPRPFMGTIIRQKDGYVLRAGDLEYRVDDPIQARRFTGKNVKIMGTFDKTNNTIHMQTIEPSPSS